MKRIAAVFAHPDDEAFGPGGTLAKLSSTHEVYILCATKGDAGSNGTKDQQEKIFRIRERELRASAEELGVQEVHFLGFRDGKLSNSLYHKVAEHVKEHLDRLRPEVIITFEPQGVSGHIDHIVMSMVVSFLFDRLDYVKEAWYYCAQRELSSQLQNDYFIYMPPGYHRDDVDMVIDVSGVWDKKNTAIQKHASQKHDIDMILSKLNKLPKKEYFLVKKK